MGRLVELVVGRLRFFRCLCFGRGFTGRLIGYRDFHQLAGFFLPLLVFRRILPALVRVAGADQVDVGSPPPPQATVAASPNRWCVQRPLSAGVLSRGGGPKKRGFLMGVISLTRFESMPGHAGKHLEIHMEALERLRGMGMQAVALQPLAGVDVGSLGMSINRS